MIWLLSDVGMKGCFVVVRKKGLGRFYTLRGLFPYLGMRALHSSFLVLKTYRNNDWPLAWLLGKDEVASSNLAISSMNLEHVASMGPGFFCTLLSGRFLRTSFGTCQWTCFEKVLSNLIYQWLWDFNPCYTSSEMELIWGRNRMFLRIFGLISYCCGLEG